MPRVVLAPDKFKGTLTAAEVAQHLADGIRSRRPDVELVTVPVADGGDGMLDAFETAGFHRVPVDAADAIGVVRPSRFVRRGAGCRDRACGRGRPGAARRVARPADRDEPGRRRGDGGGARRRLPPPRCSASVAARRPTAGSGWCRPWARG